MIALLAIAISSLSARAQVGMRIEPPCRRGYSTDSIVESGERGGTLHPAGTNFAAAYNREMGEAMEIWNDHRWKEGAERFRAIYENHPDSPWAAEAELHLACFLNFNSRYDEAEDRFLSVLTKYDDETIKRKVLRYLPQLYLQTGRNRAAMDALMMMQELPLSWQERQHFENWARIISRSLDEEEQSRECGARAAALALEVLEAGGTQVAMMNKSLGAVYEKRAWALRPAADARGYSLSELAAETGGTVRRINYGELCAQTKQRQPVLAFLAPARAPQFYERTGRRRGGTDRGSQGHFLVVMRATATLVEVLDPGGGLTRYDAQYFNYRWNGAVLMMPGQDGAAGRAVPGVEADVMRGSCCGNPPQGPRGGGCNGATGGAAGPYAPSDNAGGPGSDLGNGCNQCEPLAADRGAPVYQYGLPTANFMLHDTPLWLPDANGPSLRLSLTFNRINAQNMANYSGVNYYPFGNKWSCNLVGCYMVLTPGAHVQAYLPGGDLVEFLSSDGTNYVAEHPRNRSAFSFTGSVGRISFPSGSSYDYATNTQQMAAMRDKYGSTLTFAYDGSGRLTNVTDAAGRHFAFSYDGQGYVTNVSDSLGRNASFGYTNGNLRSLTDMGGYTTLISYNTNNWPTNVVYPSLSTLTVTYENGEQIGEYPYNQEAFADEGYPACRIRVTDSAEQVDEYFYHAFGSFGPVTVVDKSTNKWLYFHDEVEPYPYIAYEMVDGTNLTESSLGAGHQWEVRQHDPSGNITERDFARDAEYFSETPGFLPSYVAHVACEYQYLADGFVTNVKVRTNGEVSAEWRLRFDGATNLVWLRDPLSNVTTFAFDSRRDMLAYTNALGASCSLTYDVGGNPTTFRDECGHTTTLGYDDHGWMTNIMFPDGTSMASTYDSVGRRTSLRDTAGLVVLYAHDNMDHVTQVAYPDGTSMQNQYSCCGLEQTTDRLGRQTRYSYDVVGRMIEITNAMGHALGFRYGSDRNITSLVTWANGQPRYTRFDYASTNGYTRLQRRTSPLGKATTYSYHFRGWLKDRIDGRGQTNAYDYDALGRLTRIRYGGGTNVDFAYDPLDRLVSMKDALGTNSYQYDAIGRVTNQASAYTIPGFPTVAFAIGYAYDPAGNVTGRTLSGLASFTNVVRDHFAHDAMNRLILVSNQYAVSTYTYDSAGRLSAKSYGNGDVARHAYDAESRLTSLTISNGAAAVRGWWYGYNAMGMITGLMDGTTSYAYDYDALDRLTQETCDGTGVTAWTYDEAGNRLTQTGGGGTRSYGCNADDELVWVATGAFIQVTGVVQPGAGSNKWYGSVAMAKGIAGAVATNSGVFSLPNVPVVAGTQALVVTVRDVSGNTATQGVTFVKGGVEAAETLAYDLNGNVTNWMSTGTTNALTWDAENRLTRVTRNGAVILECWYDGNGRRLAKREVVDGQTNVWQYVYDGWSVVAVLDGAGQLVEYYTRGSGLAGDVGTIVAETKFAGGAATNTYYYHNNHRGDIVAVRSTNGTTLGMWDYRPFGEDRTAAGGVRPRFGFSSKEMDQASGTHYFGYRHYSRNLGRWLCNDPIGISGGLNQYVFCSNNPVNFSDPLGLCEEQPWEVEKTRLIDEARRWNRTSPRWAFREYECSAQAMRLREHLVSTVHPQYWMLNILGGARFGVEGTRFTYWNHNIVWASPWPMSPGRSQQRDFTIDAFKGSRWFFQDPNANGDVWISTLEEFRRIYPIDLSR